MTRTALCQSLTDPAEFEQALIDLGLTFDRMTLKKYTDCTHWHIRQPGSKGTLEATYTPKDCHLWLETRPGRTSDWQHDVVSNLLAIFQS